jgi:hypothetical protein
MQLYEPADRHVDIVAFLGGYTLPKVTVNQMIDHILKKRGETHRFILHRHFQRSRMVRVCEL